MKKSFTIIICLFFIYSCVPDKQKLYEEKMNELQCSTGGLFCSKVYIDLFKEVDGVYPSSLQEVYLAYKSDYPEDIDWIESYHFIDIFSKNKEWDGYFPIYNDEGTQIISYFILSAGIDGKLDNVLDVSEKLRLDNWKEKLKLYNPDDFNDACTLFEVGERKFTHIACIKWRPYNAKEEKSGDKDLLIYVHHLVYPYSDDDVGGFAEPIPN